MVALVRAGVTATCSSADKPRYVEPRRRLEPAGHPDRPRRPGPQRVHRRAAGRRGPAVHRRVAQAARRGRARAALRLSAAPLAAGWVPDADLQGIRALPVLVIAGGDDDALRDAVTAVADDLSDAEIAVTQHRRSGPLRSRTAPSHCSTVACRASRWSPTAPLHTSLLRSCTGWPSGSGPHTSAARHRTVRTSSSSTGPTPSNTVVAGDGDWRDIRMPLRSNEFSHPLRGRPGSRGRWGPAGTDGPAVGRRRRAAGGAQTVRQPHTGGPGGPAAGPGWRCAWSRPWPADRGPAAVRARPDPPPRQGGSAGGRPRPVGNLELHGFEIATVTAEFGDVDPRRRTRRARAGHRSRATLYARYWLHNRGPVPLGGLPAVATCIRTGSRQPPGRRCHPADGRQ